MKNVMWFEELNRGSLNEAGGKGANLGEMSFAGFPIPPGYVTTSGAYFKHLDANNLREPIGEILKDLDVDDSEKLNEASAKIKKLIIEGKIPQDIETDIISNYKKLNERAGRECFVAVRSSATAEDLPSISEDEHVFVRLNGKTLYCKVKELYDLVGSAENVILETPSMKKNKIEWQKVKLLYKHKTKGTKLFKIMTKTGREITITENHSLITLDKDTLMPKISSISDLKPDDLIPTVRNLPPTNLNMKFVDVLDYLKGEDVVKEKDGVRIRKSVNWKIQHPLPQKISLDESFLYFLGLYVAEGSTYENNCVMVTNSSKEIQQQAIKFLKSIRLYKDQTINKGTVRVYCKALVRLLHSLCGEPLDIKGKGRSCKIKKVPNFVFSLNKEQIGHFLRGCFDGDGYVGKTNEIQFASTSRMLAGGIIKLLEILNFNVYLRTRKTSFEVAIPYSEAEKFKELISFNNKNKLERLSNLIRIHKSKTMHPNFMESLDIPDALAKKIRDAVYEKLEKQDIIVYHCPLCDKKVGKSSKFNNRERYHCKPCSKMFYEDTLEGRVVQDYINYDVKGRLVKGSAPWNKGLIHGNLSLNELKRHCEKNGIDENFLSIFNGDVRWEKTKNIEEVDYDGNVYDFSVPDLENFVAGVGGIITHNTASFAGQQSTYLNIKGDENVVKSVKDCWASLFEPRAIYYRVQNKFEHMKVGLAAVIQMMIQSEKAGVIFSVDPLYQDPNVMSIEGGYGLGETVVSGQITPDTYRIDKENMEILDKRISKQTWMLVKIKGENQHVDIKADMQETQKMSDSEILDLAKIAKKIEEHYNFPQDLEFAVEKGNLYIVQSRPITTLDEKKGTVSTQEKKEEAVTMEQKEGKDLSQAKILTQGLGASPGVGVGKVKQIKSSKEIKRMERGDILVTDMTTPDFVPAMKKAAAIVTNTGGMTCFEGDTKILTKKGFMTMKEAYESIKNGEDLIILSYDYKKRIPVWKNAIATGRRKSKLIRVAVSQTGNGSLDYLDLTEDHKMYTFEGRKLIKKKIVDILESEESICLIEKLPNKGSSENTPNLGYLLGAIMTDGYVRLTNTKGHVTFIQKPTEEKMELIQTVKNNFGIVFNEEMAYERQRHTVSYLRGRQIRGSVSDSICFKREPALILTKLINKIDEWVLSIDEETSFNLLAGLLDGDGTFFNNRLQLYASKEHICKAAVIACLKLGIVPQVTRNRNIYNIQIVERIADILKYTKRIKGDVKDKVLGTRLFAAKQILEDVVGDVNFKGQIKPYVKKNLLLDSSKIADRIMDMADKKLQKELKTVLDSGVRMKRVRKLEELDDSFVYNIEVDSSAELDKNYIVFTRMYSPLLVSNSHAAIVSRELGVPCIVGTSDATTILAEGSDVSVDGTHGIVYEGIVSIAQPPKPEEGKAKAEAAPVTGTKIYVNLASVDLAEKVAALPVDGVGLLRAEFMVAEMEEHPKKMLKEGREQEFIDKLSEDLRRFAAAFYPRPVVYRATDFKTNEYRNLPGGEEYEPHEENPMMGWRGAARYITDPDEFKMELKAIKKVREEYHLPNLWLMIPFVRRIGELRAIKEMLHQVGIYRTRDFKLWIMVEVPSTVFLIDQFCEEGIDGISIGTNDLTQLILGIDRDNATMAKGFDERNEAVLRALKQVMTTCKKYGVTTSLCGQAPSVYPEFAEKLVEYGTTSMSVNPDAVTRTRKIVSSAEQKIMLERLARLSETVKTDVRTIRLEDE